MATEPTEPHRSRSMVWGLNPTKSPILGIEPPPRSSDQAYSQVRSGGPCGVRFHDLVDTMSQDIVDTWLRWCPWIVPAMPLTLW
jgi:hypothetical protein